MPFSQSGQVSTILRFCESLQPMSVLDVGVGMGVYGFLLRTNLEHLNLFEVKGNTGTQRPRTQWQRRIDGIEGFAGYLTPVHEYAYNQLLIGDALEHLGRIADRSYELVIAIDIVEHFDPPAGRRFLAECARVCSRAALISTPKDFIEQVVEANPLEDHRSHWSDGDIAACGYPTLLADDFSWIAVHHKPPAG